MTFLVATCTSILPIGIPDWIKVIPLGEILAADGRRWQNADPAAVVDASATNIDLVIDYEHQTDYAAKNGQPAPAAGWIKKIEARADGVWGQVEWTERAKSHLLAKEYRYFSPTFLHDKAGNVLRIIRAALTNHPAIEDLPALANATETGNHIMNKEELKALAATLGLPEDADAGTIIAAADKLAKASAASDVINTTHTAICSALSLAADATTDDVTTAIASLKETTTKTAAGEPDPAQFVSMATYQEVADGLKGLQDKLAIQDATAAVEKAMAAGKVTPANKDWALALASKDAASFAAFVENAPVIVAPGSALDGEIPDKTSALDADQKAMCAAQGISEEAFLKILNEETA